MSLESTIGRSLMRLRMIERALHDRSGWSVRCAGVEVPATVEIGEDSLTFNALLPGLCSLGDDLPLVHIVKDGDPCWTVQLDGPLGEDGTEVSYVVDVSPVSIGE